MTGHRAWILLLAAVTFLAGMAAGMLSTREEPEDHASGWIAYGDRLAREYDLSEERRAALRLFLDQYAADLNSLERRYSARILAEMAPELRDLSSRYEHYIRDRVLHPDRRDDYDRAMRPLILAAADDPRTH